MPSSKIRVRPVSRASAAIVVIVAHAGSAAIVTADPAGIAANVATGETVATAETVATVARAGTGTRAKRLRSPRPSSPARTRTSWLPVPAGASQKKAPQKCGAFSFNGPGPARRPGDSTIRPVPFVPVGAMNE